MPIFITAEKFRYDNMPSSKRVNSCTQMLTMLLFEVDLKNTLAILFFLPILATAFVSRPKTSKKNYFFIIFISWEYSSFKYCMHAYMFCSYHVFPAVPSILPELQCLGDIDQCVDGFSLSLWLYVEEEVKFWWSKGILQIM